MCWLQAALLEERDLGVLTAVVTLLLGIVSRNYEGKHRYPVSCQHDPCDSCFVPFGMLLACC